MGLFDRARSGDQAALARLATLIENDRPDAIAALDALGQPELPVHVVGITGPPGAGKSSLINHLLAELRKDGERIAVLLIDPSSQVSGGAVLGDRVRMLSWGDPDLFVRSQATRGQEGGLAPSTATLIDLFAHMGFGLVLIETVGVGQDGIDIRAVCETTVVVQAPHLGDSIQALKAGILEIADIFVVTKADLPGAQQVVRDLNAMLHLLAPGESGNGRYRWCPFPRPRRPDSARSPRKIAMHRARSAAPRQAIGEPRACAGRSPSAQLPASQQLPAACRPRHGTRHNRGERTQSAACTPHSQRPVMRDPAAAAPTPPDLRFAPP